MMKLKTGVTLQPKYIQKHEATNNKIVMFQNGEMRLRVTVPIDDDSFDENKLYYISVVDAKIEPEDTDDENDDNHSPVDNTDEH